MKNAKCKMQKKDGTMSQQKEKPIVPITDRTFEFSIRIAKLYREIGRDSVNRVLGTQLLRSRTSVGANMEEAQAAQSKPDFVSKTSIALKEARESHYWLLARGDGCKIDQSTHAPRSRVA
jgi:four helix bundle protein